MRPAFLVALGLAGCAGRSPPPAPAIGTRGNLVGEGEGPTLAEAHGAALADLAVQIRARVVSFTSRTAMAHRRGDEVRASSSIVQSIDVDASFDQGGLARRLSVEHRSGRVRVRLGLDRARYAARLRTGRIPLDAAIRAALGEARADPVADWDASRRASAAAMRALAIELEASAVDGRSVTLYRTAEIVAELETRRAVAASRLAVDVQIDDEPQITADVEALCARVFTSPHAAGRLAVRGVIQRRTFFDRDLAFAESQARLGVWNGARLLEQIVVPGSATRAGHRTPRAALQRSELALRRLILHELEISVAPRA
ncbi:MAG: hypothetical protein HYY06_26020 [Deltaproteobacteria bacterium]|nr:hypothetical protein [Deltaproteobacteria bacterium]